jgi:nicotinamide-nucleotide amidase
MKVELITIGDEILIGQTIDTNSAWMAQQFNSLGIKVAQITSVKDEREAILSQLASSFERSQLVIITGGLGPTKDDITKQVLCEYFDTVLYRNEEVLERIESYFRARNRVILESNRQQADLPRSCEVLNNPVGTASGMWFEKEGKVLVSMPGVPYEMKHIMTEEVLPRIKAQFELPTLFHYTIMTEGIGESFLAEQVKDWEESLSGEGIHLAYLPSPGIVKLRLGAEGESLELLKEKVLRKAAEFKSLMPQYIFGENDIKPEEALALQLKKNKKTIATAESCTGGYLAHLLTSIPGSSEYFKGSVVSYSNEVKMAALEVSEDSLNTQGAVSQSVVEQMAQNVRRKMETDFALATSGVAGPDGGTDRKPVGTVWIALASAEGVYAKRFQFEQNRERNIRRSALAAIGMLRRYLEGHLEIRT